MILSEYDEELHLKDTYNCGYTDGLAEGEELLARLVTVLIKEKRMNALEKALSDASFRQKLFREYDIKTEPDSV